MNCNKVCWFFPYLLVLMCHFHVTRLFVSGHGFQQSVCSIVRIQNRHCQFPALEIASEMNFTQVAKAPAAAATSAHCEPSMTVRGPLRMLARVELGHILVDWGNFASFHISLMVFT